MSQTNSGNITQFTPAAGTAIAQTIRTVRAIPKDRRGVPNRNNSVFGLPPGGYQYQLIQRLTVGPGTGGTGGQAGWEWMRAHSAS